MNDVERAISQIDDIRAQLAASTRFRGIAPKATALTAVLSFVAALAQSIWPEALVYDALRYVAVWAGFTIASIVIVAFETISRSRRLHGPMAPTLLSAALRRAMPFAAAGFVITFVICNFSPESAWMLPGLWQILLGLVGFSALPSLPREIVWAARWYFLCGAVVLGLAGSTGALSPWMMGLPFAVGQTIVAVILHVSSAKHAFSGEHDGRA